MAKVERQGLVIDRPVGDVWKYMIDISNMPQWEDSRAEWKQTSEGPIRPGTTFRSSVRFLGREVTFDLRVTDLDPGRKFAFEAFNGFGKGTKMSYLMEPVEGDKTRLSRVAEVQLHGLSKVLRPLLASIARRAGELEARNVKRIMESQH